MNKKTPTNKWYKLKIYGYYSFNNQGKGKEGTQRKSHPQRSGFFSFSESGSFT